MRRGRSNGSPILRRRNRGSPDRAGEPDGGRGGPFGQGPGDAEALAEFEDEARRRRHGGPGAEGERRFRPGPGAAPAEPDPEAGLGGLRASGGGKAAFLGGMLAP